MFEFGSSVFLRAVLMRHELNAFYEITAFSQNSGLRPKSGPVRMCQSPRALISHIDLFAQFNDRSPEGLSVTVKR